MYSITGGLLDGRRCHNLLKEKNMSDLTSFLENNGLNQFIDYVFCFMALKEMVHHCFGMNLIPGYEFKIKTFVDCYNKLNIPKTPKFHMIGR